VWYSYSNWYYPSWQDGQGVKPAVLQLITPLAHVISGPPWGPYGGWRNPLAARFKHFCSCIQALVVWIGLRTNLNKQPAVLKIVERKGLCWSPGPRWKSLQRFPRPLLVGMGHFPLLRTPPPISPLGLRQ